MEKKDIIEYGVLLTILGVIILFFMQLHNQATDRNKVLESVIQEKEATITYFINENKRVVAQKQAAEIKAEDLRTMYPEIHKSLKRDFDITVRDLKAYISAEVKAVGTGKSTITHNTFNNESGEITMDDGYLSFASSLDSANAIYKYTYSDTIKFAITTKRKWFLGKETLYGNATLSNPNAKVINSKSILINDYKDKRFGLGVGVFYDPFSNSFRAGIGINYNLIKW